MAMNKEMKRFYAVGKRKRGFKAASVSRIAASPVLMNEQSTFGYTG